VLEAVRAGRLIPVASWRLAEEIADVLRRPRLRDRYAIAEQDVQDVLVLLAPFLPSVETDAPVRDVDDAPVVGSAVTARADAIVTGDQDLLEQGLLSDWLAEQGIRVLTAAEVLVEIGR
jgi:putative PIN family toxin of toxin-antitoxin system